MKTYSLDPVDAADLQTILIVDDDAEWTEIVKLYFGDKYKVCVTNLPTEALEIVHSEHPSLIIVDLVMPSIDGFGMIHRIKDADGSGIPTILLTGWKTPEVEECAASVGCAAVLSKPITLSLLDQIVSSMISPATVSAASAAGRIIH